MELHNVLFYLYSIMHDIGYYFFLFFLNTLLNYSQSRLGALNDRMFPNTVFWAALMATLKVTYLYGILVFGRLESFGWFFLSHPSLVPRRSWLGQSWTLP